MFTIKPLPPEEIERGYQNQRKPEVLKEQQLDVRYHIEHPATTDRPRRFLEVFATILKHTNYGMVLDQYIRSSAKCSRCAASCGIYQATRNPKDIPCYRSELLLSVYRRHFTLGGRLRGRLFDDPGLTDEKVQEMAETYWNCTACRRCSRYCPSGIDHGLITHLARYILSELDISPRALVVSTREQLDGKTGNTSAIPVPALVDTLEFLEEDMKEDKGVDIRFPLDVEDAEYVFFPAVSDFLMEADTLMGNAAVMTATGGSWTIGTGYYDGINYGLFYSDYILDRVVNKVVAETKRLRGKKIMIGECGHASRSAKYFVATYAGGKDAPQVVNCMEYLYDMVTQGKLKLNPNVITETVTYHDPCNIARPGWVVDQPREILKSFCKNYVEMSPNRRDNICCGGGGGTVSIDEIRPYRTSISGKLKAEQIRRTGAKYCVAPCANCKKQLRELMEDQGIDCEIVGLHDLVYKAIIFDEKLKIAAEPAETAGEEH